MKQNKTKWNFALDIAGKSTISVHAETIRFFIILGNKQISIKNLLIFHDSQYIVLKCLSRYLKF